MKIAERKTVIGMTIPELISLIIFVFGGGYSLMSLTADINESTKTAQNAIVIAGNIQKIHEKDIAELKKIHKANTEDIKRYIWRQTQEIKADIRLIQGKMLIGPHHE